MGFGKALVRGGLTESFRKLFPHVEVGEDTVREWVREHVAGRAVVPDVKGLRYTMRATRIASSSGRPASRRERKMDVME